MPDVCLTKDIEGRLCGISEKDNAGYERFLHHAINMPADESIKFSWRKPRSPKYHKRHFVMLNALFKEQETFLDAEVMRKWGEMEAGHCERIVVPSTGEVVKVPKSIDYASLEQVDFEALHNAVFSFFRTELALLVFWPQLSFEQAYDKMDSILMEFEQ